MPRLFRDDLVEIEKIIKNELKPREYKLETKDYEYEEIESIPSDTKQTVDFHIQTHDPYISIDFNRFSARVYAGDDNLDTTGALTKIIEILSRKERKVLFWSQKIAVWIAPILFIAPIQALTEIGEIKSTKHWVALGVSLLAAIWWIVSFYSSMYKFSTIRFVFHKESPGFLTRNKDQIILVILGAVIGALATGLFTFIFKTFR